MEKTRAACKYMVLTKVLLYFISSSDLESFCPFVAFSCVMAGLQSCILFLAATCPEEALRRGRALPISSVSSEFLSLRIIFTLDLDLEGSTSSTVCCFLICCSLHTSVKEIVGTNRTSENQGFIQMKPPHWVCGRDRATCSMGRRHTMGWRGIGSGIKSVHSWIRDIAHSGLSQTPPASQKPGSVRRKCKKGRVAVTWHKQELIPHSQKVSSLLWIHHVNGVNEWTVSSSQNSEMYSLTKWCSATLKEKLYIR